MRVHQLPFIPDRLPVEKPPPRPDDNARLRETIEDIVALRVNPRNPEERKKREKQKYPANKQPDEEPRPDGVVTKIDLLT